MERGSLNLLILPVLINDSREKVNVSSPAVCSSKIRNKTLFQNFLALGLVETVSNSKRQKLSSYKNDDVLCR